MSLEENMKCPVCDTEIKIKKQESCLECAWEFEWYFGELSRENQERYEKKLKTYKSHYNQKHTIKTLENEVLKKVIKEQELEKKIREQEIEKRTREKEFEKIIKQKELEKKKERENIVKEKVTLEKSNNTKTTPQAILSTDEKIEDNKNNDSISTGISTSIFLIGIISLIIGALEEWVFNAMIAYPIGIFFSIIFILAFMDGKKVEDKIILVSLILFILFLLYALYSGLSIFG